MKEPRQNMRRLWLGLSDDDMALWRAVTAHVKPRHPTPMDNSVKALIKSSSKRHVSDERRAGKIDIPFTHQVSVKPLVTLDRRSKKEIAKGRLEIDVRLDLHGLCAAEAHTRLVNFLIRAQREGARVALIVTGKGGRTRKTEENSSADRSEIGVLKRQAPLWLADPRLRHIVGGFGEAALAHGGSGALYVRIRRL